MSRAFQMWIYVAIGIFQELPYICMYSGANPKLGGIARSLAGAKDARIGGAEN
jgi:hypothetical protein